MLTKELIAMPKAEKGQKLENFAVTTLKRGKTTLSELVSKEGKTAIVFLRYYGCPLCQYDMLLYKDAYEKITAGGNELVVALQSTGESIAAQTDLVYPFDVILDPEMILYKTLDIRPMEPPKEGAAMPAPTPEMLALFKKIDELGIKHGPNEGIEEQLPAYFVVDKELNISVAAYCGTPFDVPAPEDFPALFA